MRPAWERELIGVRVNLSADPEAAHDAAKALLRRARVNSERVRATLTMGWAHRAAGRRELLKDAIERASGYRRPGNLALSEVFGVSANYLVLVGDARLAFSHAEKAVSYARPLAEASAREVRGHWKSASLVRAVVHRAGYSATLTVRAEARFHVSEKAEAIADAIEALKWADPRYVPHVHRAAVVAACATLLGTGATPETCAEVLRVTSETDRMLSRRRVSPKSRQRLMLQALQGVAFALLGSVHRAEAVLTSAIEGLESIGFRGDAKLVAEQFVSILASRAAQDGRARLVARKYGVMAPPAAKKRPTRDDDDDPIGF